MTFSEFAKILYPFCGNGGKTSDFVLTLIENIMEIPANEDAEKAANDEYNPLAGLDIGTLEKIYNGNSKISKKNASAIFTHLDKGRFSDYIDSLPTDTLALLKDSLKNLEIETGAAHGVPDKCADILTSILMNLAGVKNASTSLQNVNALPYIEMSTELVPSFTTQRGMIPESDLHLLMEADHSCPLCGAPLIGQKNDNGLAKYRITSIVPDAPTEELKKELGGSIIHKDQCTSKNKIALCIPCNNAYTANTTKDECLNLLNTKERLSRNSNALEVLDKMYLEEQIEAVIRQIANASPEQLSDELTYNAVRINEKIKKSNIPLLVKVRGFVVPYYNFIKTVFSQLEREGKLIFDDVANDVLRSYRKLQASNLSQDEIYNQLVDWFNKKTNAQSVVACEIIVAFFVQNCEVFHALAQ